MTFPTRLSAVCLLFLAARSDAQFFEYQVPDLYLQATNGGQFKAYLPDKCGVEKFQFDWKKSGGPGGGGGGFGGGGPGGNPWESGPPVSFPTDGYWTFENPSMGLRPGDLLDYRASVLFNGQQFSKPEAQWNVSDLVEQFTPPPPNPDECKNSSKMPEPTTPPTTTTPTTPPTTTPTTTPPPLTPHKPPPTPPQQKEKEPTTKKPDEEDGPGPCSKPWTLEPSPSDTRIASLEKQVTRLQCEIGGFTNHYKQMTKAVGEELTDLKKLNYAMVARMQRLESLLRSSPLTAWP